MRQRVDVALGERSYPIDIGHGSLGRDFTIAQFVRGSDALVVTNETVGPLYLARLAASLGERHVETHVLPDGEQFKTLASIEAIYDSLFAMRAGRQTTIIALGGGVVGDMAGFAAASYLRGLEFIQVPTTLLAQVDSSVGGKTGVNLPGGKNLVGAFHQPNYVAIDIATLDTLPAREFAAGLAEVIKHALLDDAEFFAWLEANVSRLNGRDPEALATAIRRCCEIKAAVVAADEREAGRRALLNLGHTFGHAIEQVAGYGEWLHGEAVAAGLVMAAIASGLAAADSARLTTLLEAANLPVRPPPVGAANLREAMQADKKVRDRRLRLVLLRRIGAAEVTADYDEAALEAALATADG